MNDATDYQTMFRQMLVRSVRAALTEIDLAAPRLDEDQRDRSLYALSLALDLAEAWPVAKELTLVIAPFMENQGYRYEWMYFLERGIVQATSRGDRNAQARLQLHLGRLYQLLGDYAASDDYLVPCRQFAEEVGDRELLVRSLDRLSTSASEQHQLSRARALAEETLALLDPDDPACAPSHRVLGVIALQGGRWDEAMTHYRRALTLREREGNPHLVAMAYAQYMQALNVREDGLGPGVQVRRHVDDVDWYAKEYAKILSYYQDAIRLYHEAGNLYDEAVALKSCGYLAWRLGNHEDALGYYAGAESLCLQINSRFILTLIYNSRGYVLCDMARYVEAEQSFAHSIRLAREHGDSHVSFDGLVALGDVYLRMQRYDDAVAAWQEALSELADLQEAPPHLFEEIYRRLREAADEQETLVAEIPPVGLTHSSQ